MLALASPWGCFCGALELLRRLHASDGTVPRSLLLFPLVFPLVFPLGPTVQLSLLLLGCWSCYPVLWLFCDGARALSSDSALSIYTCLDILSQCIFGLMLVRNVNGMSADLFTGAGSAANPADKDEEAQAMLLSGEEDAS